MLSPVEFCFANGFFGSSSIPLRFTATPAFRADEEDEEEEEEEEEEDDDDEEDPSGDLKNSSI